MYFTLILVQFQSKTDDHEKELTIVQTAAVSRGKEQKQPTIQDVKQKDNPGAENLTIFRHAARAAQRILLKCLPRRKSFYETAPKRPKFAAQATKLSHRRDQEIMVASAMRSGIAAEA